MSLDVYYKPDILNALLAAEQANDAAFESVTVTDDNTAAFRRGYHAALTTLALAFGLVQSENLECHERLSTIKPLLHSHKL